jgi:hypothetical protein
MRASLWRASGTVKGMCCCVIVAHTEGSGSRVFEVGMAGPCSRTLYVPGVAMLWVMVVAVIATVLAAAVIVAAAVVAVVAVWLAVR